MLDGDYGDILRETVAQIQCRFLVVPVPFFQHAV